MEKQPMRVFAVPGKRVTDPVSHLPVPAEGMDVADSNYWQTRLAAGEVTLTDPKSPPAKKRGEPTQAPKE